MIRFWGGFQAAVDVLMDKDNMALPIHSTTRESWTEKTIKNQNTEIAKKIKESLESLWKRSTQS